VDLVTRHDPHADPIAGVTPVVNERGTEILVVDPANVGGFLDAVNAGAFGPPPHVAQGRTVPETHVVLDETTDTDALLARVTTPELEGETEPVPFELTELGAGQAAADRMTEREVGPGFLQHQVEQEAGQ
jgi:hypothetical protein